MLEFYHWGRRLTGVCIMLGTVVLLFIGAYYADAESQTAGGSTAALVQEVLADSTLTQFTAYNSGQDAMRMNMETYEIYPVMCAQADYYETLAGLYEQARVLTPEEYGAAAYEEIFYPFHLEVLLANEIYMQGLNADAGVSYEAVDARVRAANARVRDEREQYPELYSSSSDGFYWYYSMDPETLDGLDERSAELLKELAQEK